MKKVYIGTKPIIIPSSWNQLSKEDLLFISELFNKKYIKEEIVVMLLAYFAKMPMQKIIELKPAYFIEMEHQFDFLFQNIKLTKQLLPIIKVGFKKYAGPSAGLTNMTYEQFIIFSETYFAQYTKTQNENFLNLFVASLYVPKNKNFESDDITKNAKKISKLSNAHKTAILLFYQGNRNYIASKFPKLFSKSQKEKKENEFDFLEVIELLNKEDVSKNNTIRKTNIYEIFTRLNNILKNERKHSN